MTLVAAWVEQNTLCFGSDSRLTLAGGGAFDYCAKVISAPVRLLGAGYEGAPPQLIHEFELGMAFVGNFTTAYSLRESLLELLPRLQVIPELRRVSLDIVIDVTRALFESLAREICQMLATMGLAELLVGGYCQSKKGIRAFRLKIDFSTYPMVVVAEEFWPSEAPIFLGSGEVAARELHASDRSLSPYIIMKRIADDPAIASVGGALQVGYFREREFHVTGIQDYFVDEDERTVTVRVLHRGIDLREFMKRMGAEDMNFCDQFRAAVRS